MTNTNAFGFPVSNSGGADKIANRQVTNLTQAHQLPDPAQGKLEYLLSFQALQSGQLRQLVSDAIGAEQTWYGRIMESYRANWPTTRAMLVTSNKLQEVARLDQELAQI